jgi:alpha-glucosidase (family GH31 glycosyl hydrolase)
VGDFRVSVDGGITLAHAVPGTELTRELARDVRFRQGDGTELLEMQAGSYRVVSGETTWSTLGVLDAEENDGVLLLTLGDDADEPVGEAVLSTAGDMLRIDVTGAGNRIAWSAACSGDDRFAGLGAHAQDVDHTGERFALWVSEPGIGKSDSDELPEDWPLAGSKHATSLPDPFLVRPEPMGLLLAGDQRVEVDLCTGDRWEMASWSGGATFVVFAGDTPLDVVARHARAFGEPAIPPDWALAPWNDAIRGSARVREVARTLREAGAPSSVLWTEDWKGANMTAFGYRLSSEWDLDAGMYPDAAALDAELEAAGFKWFAYFAPFLTQDTRAWNEAEDLLIRDADGTPYTFTGVTFEPTSVLDLARPDAQDWARAKMEAAVAIGFDGWMTDYGEWLPPDAVLADGALDGMSAHQRYPLAWQQVSAEALADSDAAFFSRSGWSGSPTISPVNWVGDQRTSFDADDGYPSVVPMMIGTAIAGWPLTGSDVAGYQSIGNAPSDKELWFRWASLGAFSPILRTHHGAFEEDNWQFDTDADTLAHWVRVARDHTALFPYLRGLLETARATGAPLVRAPFLHHPEQPWGRTDAYLLGPSLLVAPVLERGATSRLVDLPAGTTWYDWWTGEVATSGTIPAPVDTIPVFAPAGAIVPLYTTIPDTLVDGPLPGLVTRSDADTERTVRVYAGARGSFTEADGTRYTSDGTATASGSTSATLSSGELSVNGLHLIVTGSVARRYTLEVIAP